MNLKAIKTKIFKENQNLAAFITENIPSVKEGSVIAVSSKIAALSEGRVLPPRSRKEFEKIVRRESSFALKTHYCFFTIKDGAVMTNAGVDRSNAAGKIILLPKDSYKTARNLRAALKKFYKVKNLGIIITDSFILPLRAGVTGAAVGYSGFKGVKNYVGKPDIFGRKLKMTMVDAADGLAAAAGLMTGEAAEQTPLCVIENAPVVFTDKDKKNELKYPPKKDLYYPLLKSAARRAGERAQARE